MAQSEEAAAGRRPSRRQLVVRLLLAVVVIAVVYLWLLPKLVDVSQVWATLRAMTWLELATLLVAAVWNLVSYMLPQLAALPGLSLGQAALESHTSTAVGNLPPGGPGRRAGGDLPLLHLLRVQGAARSPCRCWSRGCGTTS